ncbi:hypothetical protein S1OALGB6SA_738 [Olavius algarvensis spirochete endosymbiont]|nr:MAG: hypothetical protein [Olavius algarvensis spirochete endosymbiont]VDA99667.1 hypothetical protein S1OALGB6SA_738 [Olavius algarvensis spirochete endosymbiont]
MTLNLRRNLFNILLIPSLIVTLAAGLALIAWYRSQLFWDYEIPKLTALWWSIWRVATPSSLPWALHGIAFLSIFSLFCELVLRRRFGHSPSPEMFFMRFFILTLPFQAPRILLSLVSVGSLELSWSLTATRLAWFARFFGILSLLNISVFFGDISLRHSGLVLGMEFLIAIFIAATMPFDITQPLGNLLIRSGIETALALVIVSMELLIVLGLLGTAIMQGNPYYYLLSGALLLVVAGMDLTFFLSKPLLIPGAVLLVAGVFFSAWTVQKIYQWL